MKKKLVWQISKICLLILLLFGWQMQPAVAFDCPNQGARPLVGCGDVVDSSCERGGQQCTCHTQTCHPEGCPDVNVDVETQAADGCHPLLE